MRKNYPLFLNQLDVLNEVKSKIHEKIRDFFVDENEFKDTMDEILVEAREGDIVIIEGRFYYISGFEDDRTLLYFGPKIMREDEVPTSFLPYEARNVINGYNIKTRANINKYYPGLNIRGIINEEGRRTYFR